MPISFARRFAHGPGIAGAHRHYACVARFVEREADEERVEIARVMHSQFVDHPMPTHAVEATGPIHAVAADVGARWRSGALAVGLRGGA